MKVCIFGRAQYEQLKSRTQQLATHGVEFHILSLQTGQMDHATVHTVGGGKVLRGAAFLTLPWMARRLIRRLRPDVIDIHGVSSYGGYCFSPISDIPVCATVYGSDVTAHAATSRVGRVIANRGNSSREYRLISARVDSSYVRRSPSCSLMTTSIIRRPPLATPV